MKILKNEYKIIKDKGFLGKRFDTYTIEKKITYDNGETETRLRVFIPYRDGDINTVNLDDLYFPISVTLEEWKQLPEEYNKAWSRGTMTKEMSENIERLVLLLRENKRQAKLMKEGVM